MKKRLSTILSFALLVSLLLTGCGQSASVDETGESGKDALTVALTGDVVTMDPNTPLDSTNDALAQAEVFEALFTVSEDGELIKHLCESYEYQDETTLLLTLREGVKFHNGETMTAEDVLFSYQRAADNPIIGSNWTSVDFENSEVVDSTTLRLKLFEPYASLLYNLATTGSYVISKSAYEADPDGFSRAPIGTGPYKFVSRESGVSLTFTKFDGYWDEENAANISNLVLKVVPEATNRTIQLETGEVDIALDVQVSDVELLKNNNDITVYEGRSDTVVSLRINTNRNEVLSDARVRLALIKAIDRETLVNNVYKEYAEVANSVLASEIPGYKDDYAKRNYGYDLQAAKDLLAEAGYGDGFKVEIMMYESSALNTAAEIIANMWKEIGVDAKLTIYEMGTFFSLFEAEDYDMCATRRTTINGDGDQDLFTMYHSDYQTLYQNPAVDALLEESRRTLDNEARYEIYGEIQTLLQEAAIMVPIAETMAVYAANSQLQGLPAPKMISRGASLAGVK